MLQPGRLNMDAFFAKDLPGNDEPDIPYEPDPEDYDPLTDPRYHEARQTLRQLNQPAGLIMPTHPDTLTNYTDAEIDMMDAYQVQCELAYRAYRTRGPNFTIRQRLKDAMRNPKQLRDPVERPKSELEIQSDEVIRELREERQAEQAALDDKRKMEGSEGVSRDDVLADEPIELRLAKRMREVDEKIDELERRRWICSWQDEWDQMAEEMKMKALADDDKNLTDIGYVEGGLSGRWPADQWPEIEKYYKIGNQGDMPEGSITLEHNPELAVQQKRRFVDRSQGMGTFTLMEIHEHYHVPLRFLGDVCCKWGAPAPVPLDVPVKELISGEFVWHLIETVHYFDPFDLDDLYIERDIIDLGRKFKMRTSDLEKVCDQLDIRLPFGVETQVSRDDYIKICKRIGVELPPDPSQAPDSPTRFLFGKDTILPPEELKDLKVDI
ncbi:unnamed protein product [Vitrella brassicaformis CCMP3155]|uniref:Uncharacterized protein n=2 Tax=Vitrella brassicaformis TaxID=1169539 RepID=A0A0G4F2X3_VITBC|nr:unnamed protein product [Vitrella brassicaformis CCMP3155]|eukprot:CEM06393.1 unnamed protein product [Vitrella brassicaformis CCMP3155]